MFVQFSVKSKLSLCRHYVFPCFDAFSSQSKIICVKETICKKNTFYMFKVTLLMFVQFLAALKKLNIFSTHKVSKQDEDLFASTLGCVQQTI